MLKPLQSFSLTAVVGAVASATLIIGLIASTILHTEYTQLGDTLQQATEEFQLALTESEKINAQLSYLNEKQCSEAVLNAMRIELAQAWHILDIAYIDDDKMLCTAATGLFIPPKPFGDEPYSFITSTDIKVYFERDARHPIYAALFQKPHVLRTPRYSILLNPRKLWPTNQLHGNAEYVYLNKTNNHTIHIKGQPGLWQAAKAHRWQVSSQGFYLYRCQSESAFCLAVLHNYSRIMKENIGLLTLALLLSLVTSVLTFYVISHQADANRTLKHRVKQGFAKESFYWLYQPIVSLHDQKIIGCEVLARFKDSMGDLSPVEFIPEIKRQGKSWPFTCDMIRFVQKQLEPDATFPAAFKVSLNLSPSDIENGNARELLHMPELTASRFKIALELTEDH